MRQLEYMLQEAFVSGTSRGILLQPACRCAQQNERVC